MTEADRVQLTTATPHVVAAIGDQPGLRRVHDILVVGDPFLKIGRVAAGDGDDEVIASKPSSPSLQENFACVLGCRSLNLVEIVEGDRVASGHAGANRREYGDVLRAH